MDREQEEFQFLGFYGICKESIKILTTRRKIFTKITLSLILPFSVIFLANFQITMILAAKIISNEHTLDVTQPGTTQFNKISDAISCEWFLYWLAMLIYLFFSLIFSLLSTSAVVYTVTCIYTGKEITFRKIMSVIPKVSKRLFTTFLWISAILFAYHVAAFFLFIVWAILYYRSGDIGNIILFFLIVIHLMGVFHITAIWKLASVVSILEDIYGVQAMIKSKALISGKIWGVAVLFVLILSVLAGGIWYLFENLVVLDGDIRIRNIGWRICYGALSLFLLSLIFLLSILVWTIIYFVCKSYHHENIDKSTLYNLLEAYHGETVPLTTDDVQMEQMEV